MLFASEEAIQRLWFVARESNLSTKVIDTIEEIWAAIGNEEAFEIERGELLDKIDKLEEERDALALDVERLKEERNQLQSMVEELETMLADTKAHNT